MAIETFNHAKRNGSAVLKDAQHKYEDAAEALQDAILEGKRSLQRMKRMAEHAMVEGSEKVKDAAITVDRKARKNPWAFVGGAAIAALALGVALGACARKKQPWEN